MNHRFKLHLLTAVWGDHYTNLFKNICIPSLLASKNIPFLVENSQAHYSIFTTSTDAAKIKESPEIQLLSKHIPLSFHTIINHQTQKNHFDMHWMFWQAGVQISQETQSIHFLIIPDMIYANGTLERWLRHLQNGKRAVFAPGIRAVDETFIPALLKKTNNDSTIIDIKQQDLISLFGEHIHPITACLSIHSGRYYFHPETMFLPVESCGLYHRIMSQQPFIIDLNHFITDRQICPLNNFDDVIFDECSTISVTSLLQYIHWYNHRTPIDAQRITDIGIWSEENTKKIILKKESGNHCLLQPHPNQNTSTWTSAENDAEELRKKILNARLIYKIWKLLQRNQASISANILAAAELSQKLHEKLPPSQEFTLLIPIDSAYQKLSDPQWNEWIAQTDGIGLLNFVRACLIPQRLNAFKNKKIFLQKCSDDEFIPSGTFTTANLNNEKIAFFTHSQEELFIFNNPVLKTSFPQITRIVDSKRAGKIHILFIDSIPTLPSSAHDQNGAKRNSLPLHQFILFSILKKLASKRQKTILSLLKKIFKGTLLHEFFVQFFKYHQSSTFNAVFKKHATPHSARAFASLLQIYRMLQASQDALKKLYSSLLTTKQNPQPLCLIESLINKIHPNDEEFFKIAQNIASKYPLIPDLQLEIAKWHIEKGQYNQCLPPLNHIMHTCLPMRGNLKVKNLSFEASLLQGIAYETLEQPQKALGSFFWSIWCQPHPKPHRHIANILLKQKQFKDSLIHWNLGMENATTSPLNLPVLPENYQQLENQIDDLKQIAQEFFV